MTGNKTMGPVRRWWWDALLGRRRHLLFFAERWPRGAGRAVRVRALTHFLVGNVHATTALVALAAAEFYGLSSKPLAATIAVLWLMTEIVLKGVQYVPSQQRPFMLLRRVAGWREGLSLRSAFPGVWAEVAHRTQAIQAEVGSGGGEPRPPGKLRPIADHPKMSWVPQVEWPRVSFWCSPPPGRAFAAWDDILGELAASFPKIEAIVLEYGASAASVGRVTFIFIDQLADTPGSAELADIDAGFIQLDDTAVLGEGSGRHLHIVPDENLGEAG